jgi:hypothetical protein
MPHGIVSDWARNAERFGAMTPHDPPIKELERGYS